MAGSFRIATSCLRCQLITWCSPPTYQSQRVVARVERERNPGVIERLPRVSLRFTPGHAFSLHPAGSPATDRALSPNWGHATVPYMQVIARRTLRQFWERHPQAERPIRAWFAVVAGARWQTPANVKRQFGTTVDLSRQSRDLRPRRQQVPADRPHIVYLRPGAGEIRRHARRV